MRRFHYDNEEPDFSKLNRIGGWLIILIIRLVLSLASAVMGVLAAAGQNNNEFIVLYAVMFIFAAASLALLFMRKKLLRYVYIGFSLACLTDFFLAENGTAFVATMIVETLWVFYLFVSVRVKLLTGEMKLPDGDSPGDIQ